MYKKTSIFLNDKLASIIIDEIKKGEGSMWAWCLMPAHLHFLFDPSGDEKDLIKLIKLIKGRSAQKINKIYGKRNTWQESFYDHILRKEEDIKHISFYILNNPVRKGIVDDWQKYPYSWSKFYTK